MLTEHINLKIAFILAAGFAFASLLGYFSNRLKLSPILGYLLGGYLIGPYSPGFVVDLQIAEQLAEIGVILMLFGVGLHFKWQDLVRVKNIAIPGALGQTFVASVIGTLVITSIGWSIEAGIIFGMAIGVASTVVMVRILSDNGLLNTTQGHISVGWLIVEDIITVGTLLLIPILSDMSRGEGFSFLKFIGSIAWILFKFTLLTTIMFTFGKIIVSYILNKIVLSKSHELFTVSILAITFLIALGSSVLFGTSIALGAFIAGMVVGQTEVRRQVSLNTQPIKDTFVVIFFLTVGMLFNPGIIIENFGLFIATLFIIVILKPLAAFGITIALKHSFKTALTIALALAQIGEFSFILTEEAMAYEIFPDTGYDVIVACALVSIALNPLLFKWFGKYLH